MSFMYLTSYMYMKTCMNKSIWSFKHNNALVVCNTAVYSLFTLLLNYCLCEDTAKHMSKFILSLYHFSFCFLHEKTKPKLKHQTDVTLFLKQLQVLMKFSDPQSASLLK